MTVTDVADIAVLAIFIAALVVVMWLRGPERHDLHSLRHNERIRNQLRRKP